MHGHRHSLAPSPGSPRSARLIGALVAALLATLVVPVRAAAPDDEDEPRHRTVITPARRGGTVFDSDRAVELRTRRDMDEEVALDGPAALDPIPGVFLQRTNRAAGSPIVRGLVGPSNLVLIDGLRQNTSISRTGPNQYAALLDPMALDAVEVVLGPGSVLYGSDAMGGVIHYLTRGLPEEEGVHGEVQGRLSSADLGAEGAVHVGGRRGPLAGWVGGAIRRHGTLRTGDGEDVPLSDYTHGDWRGRVGADLGSGWELSATYLATRVRDAGRIDGVGKGDVRLYDNDDHLVHVDLARRERSGPLSELKLVLGYHQLAERVDRFRCETDAAGSVSDREACLDRARDTLTGVRVNEDTVHAALAAGTANLDWFSRRLRLLVGVDGRFETVESARRDAGPDDFAFEERERGQFSDGSTYGGVDGFAWVEARPWVDPGKAELVLTGGARLTHVRAHAPDVPGLGDVGYDFTGAVANAGVRVLLRNRYNVYATWSQGYRAPNLQESTVLGDTGATFEIPNGDLGPERSDTFEAGVKAFTPWVVGRVSAFHTIISDAIVREDATWQGDDTVGGKPVVRRINAAKAFYDGVEVSAQSGRVWGVSLLGAVAWIRGDVRRPDGGEEPARRVPPLTARAALRWDHAEGFAHAEVVVRGATRQDRLSPGDRGDLRICEDPTAPGQTLGAACDGTPGWATLDVRAGVRPLEDLTIDLAVDNALDVSYRRHASGFDAPGIDARLLAAWRF